MYLPFDDNSCETKTEYEQCLIEISAALIDDQINVIMGDFNADIYRGRRFDKLLTEFINTNQLLATDLINTQTCNYSFSFKNKNNHYFAHIDHILIT